MPFNSLYHIPASFKFIVTIFIGLMSCTGNNAVQNSTSAKPLEADTVTKLQPQKESPRVITQSSIPDSIKRFIADDYPLTDDMFGLGTNTNDIKAGDLVSQDKVWFTNDTLQQTIVIALYTDNFRMAEFYFQNKNIPQPLMERMELHTVGHLASQQQKETSFKRLIATAAKISKKYFKSNKGFEIGDHKTKAINIYGKPDSKTLENGFEVFEWNFEGDILYNGNADLKGKPLAKDSYGHQVTMFFQEDQLIAIILYNHIP